MPRRGIVLALLVLVGLAALAQAASITLAWDYAPGPDPAVQFRVYRSLGAAGACTGAWDATAYGVVAVPTQTFTDTAVVAGATYCYRVTAADAAGGESTPSNVVFFLVPTPPPTPAAPTNLRGTVGP